MSNLSLEVIIKSLILKTIIFKVMAYDGSCGKSFQGKCHCGTTYYDQILRYMVNCTNEGFLDTSVLEHMPVSVEVLLFTGNMLIDLPWNIFGRINEYPKLRIIDMSNNHIREIHGKRYQLQKKTKSWFHNYKSEWLGPKNNNNYLSLFRISLTRESGLLL